MIRHILLWDYKDETSPEERARLEAELASLPARVPVLRQVEWGPVVGGRNQSFSHCFIMQFDDMDALTEYTTHAEHIKFALPFRDACSVQVVADIEIGA
jgi:Stress responsive A/B Barrel Domain